MQRMRMRMWMVVRKVVAVVVMWVFDEQMAAGEDARDGQADGVFLSDDDLADLRDQCLYPCIHSGSLFCRAGKLSSVTRCRREEIADKGFALWRRGHNIRRL